MYSDVVLKFVILRVFYILEHSYLLEVHRQCLAAQI